VPSWGEGFHWRRALAESFALLAIEQAYVVHTDFKWVVSENGVRLITIGATIRSPSPRGCIQGGTTAIPIGSAMWGIRFKGP
jgi:hypothetical protein